MYRAQFCECWKGRTNLKLLANSAGMSVQMVDTFYLKPLNVLMNREALVG